MYDGADWASVLLTGDTYVSADNVDETATRVFITPELKTLISQYANDTQD
jgi:hypothetical protein